MLMIQSNTTEGYTDLECSCEDLHLFEIIQNDNFKTILMPSCRVKHFKITFEFYVIHKVGNVGFFVQFQIQIIW